MGRRRERRKGRGEEGEGRREWGGGRGGGRKEKRKRGGGGIRLEEMKEKDYQGMFYNNATERSERERRKREGRQGGRKIFMLCSSSAGLLDSDTDHEQGVPAAAAVSQTKFM